MKKLKIVISSLLVCSLLNVSAYAAPGSNVYVTPPSYSYTQTNTRANTSNSNNSVTNTSTVNNSDSNNTVNNTNSNNTISTNTTNLNSNNTNSNNTYNISYYTPYNNTQVSNNGGIGNGLTGNTVQTLNSAMDYKLTIGGISILDSFTTVKNNYHEYLKPSSNPQMIFFNGGPGDYGDFLLALELNTYGSINKISYSQFNLINPILAMNLGNIKAGDDYNLLLNEYGQWDGTEVNYNVKQVFYNNLMYKNYPIKLIVYVNNFTNKIYGYTIQLK